MSGFEARTILLVDDSPTHRSLVRVFLAGIECDFLQAEDGEQALQLLEGGAVDLIIADVEMPRMDGLAFVRALRKSLNRAIRDIPVVMLTASATITDEIMRAGATESLRKPISSAGLSDVVKRILGDAHA